MFVSFLLVLGIIASLIIIFGREPRRPSGGEQASSPASDRELAGSSRR